MKTEENNQQTITVWDRFVRVFHWALVATIATAAVTGFLLDASWIKVHVWAAVGALGLVVVRIIWGFWGGTYARFSSFVMGPKRVWQYFQALRQGKEKRYIGHNPLGGAMVLALFGVVLGIVASGVVLLGGVLKTGPLAFAVPYRLGESMQEVHELLAIVLLGMIAAHIAGVVFESRRHKENLARAMVSGKKNMSEGDVTMPVRKASVGVAVLVSVVVLGGGGWLALTMAARSPANMPVAEIHPLVADECSACHMVYHPSLLPAKNWDRIVSTLEEHYGEDASLDEDSTSEIREWMMAHAAETADTRASYAFAAAQGDGGDPLSITQTEFWKARHAKFGDAVFSRKGIYSRANCVACHKDAETGLFSPFNIYIPQE